MALLRGGATIENIGEYRGQWISNVGIYDEDDELILITSTPLVEVSQDASVVASYPIDIHTVLDNASECYCSDRYFDDLCNT